MNCENEREQRKKNVILESLVVGGSGDDSGISVTTMAAHLGKHERVIRVYYFWRGQRHCFFFFISVQ